MSDVIRLKDLTIFGFYGVSPAEREVGQKIQMDIDLKADLTSACRTDSLQDTINYESIYSAVMEVVGGETALSASGGPGRGDLQSAHRHVSNIPGDHSTS